MPTKCVFWSSRKIFSSFRFASSGKVAIVFKLALLFAAYIVCGSARLAHANSFKDTTHKELRSVELASLENTCLLTESDLEVPILASLKTTREPESKMFGAAHATIDMLSELSLAITAYRSRLGKLRVRALEEAKLVIGRVIVGTASMYNPDRPGYKSGGTETASGEPYNAQTWTAAIQINLRDEFGGVRYGKNYQPAYALVEGAEKQAIVKINDVGPLKPGRIIDLNERTMRYFDPTLKLGLIHNVDVTPLPGDGWTPGPIEGEHLISFASKLEKLASTLQ
jgi:rare lipoprotein A